MWHAGKHLADSGDLSSGPSLRDMNNILSYAPLVWTSNDKLADWLSECVSMGLSLDGEKRKTKLLAALDRVAALKDKLVADGDAALPMFEQPFQALRVASEEARPCAAKGG